MMFVQSGIAHSTAPFLGKLGWAFGETVIAFLPLAGCCLAIWKGRPGTAIVIPVAGFLTFIGVNQPQETKLAAPSPDTQFEVQLRQPWFDNTKGLEVRICGPQSCDAVYRHPTDSLGASIAFAHVAWCDSSRSFAVLTDGVANVRFAYDVLNSSVIPFESLEQCMEQSIRLEHDLDGYLLDEYGWVRLKRDGRPEDAIDWTRHKEAHQVFRQKHPEW
jgi:hypothetical protein